MEPCSLNLSYDIHTPCGGKPEIIKHLKSDPHPSLSAARGETNSTGPFKFEAAGFRMYGLGITRGSQENFRLCSDILQAPTKRSCFSMRSIATSHILSLCSFGHPGMIPNWDEEPGCLRDAFEAVFRMFWVVGFRVQGGRVGPGELEDLLMARALIGNLLFSAFGSRSMNVSRSRWA